MSAAVPGLDAVPALRLPPALQLLWFVARPLELFDRCARTLGDTFRLALPGLGHTVFVSHPDDVRTVFSADAEVVRAGEGNTFLRPVVGTRSLLTLDGPAHRRERKLVSPPLHGERIRAYTETIRRRAAERLARVPVGETVRLRDVFKDLTLEIVAEVVFGASDDDERREAVARFGRLADAGNSPLLLVPALRSGIAGVSPWNGAARAIREADDFIARRIRASRPEDGRSIVDLFLATRDEDGAPMPEAAVRDELVTLLLAGHETTATALAWLFAHLAVDASGSALERARHEPAWREGAIHESLRLTPVLANVNRRLRAPLTIRAGELPRGVYVSPCIHLAHRRPEAFADPTRFDPSRFVDHDPAPFTYFPFGGGVRRCVGMAFALLEMREIADVFLQGARWRRAPRSSIRPSRRGITVAPADGGLLIRTA